MAHRPGRRVRAPLRASRPLRLAPPGHRPPRRPRVRAACRRQPRSAPPSGPMKMSPASSAQFGQYRAFGEEAVAGMDRVAAARLRRLHDGSAPTGSCRQDAPDRCTASVRQPRRQRVADRPRMRRAPCSIPSRRHVRMMRSAISPRLAMKTRRITTSRPTRNSGWPCSTRLAVGDQQLDHPSRCARRGRVFISFITSMMPMTVSSLDLGRRPRRTAARQASARGRTCPGSATTTSSPRSASGGSRGRAAAAYWRRGSGRGFEPVLPHPRVAGSASHRRSAVPVRSKLRALEQARGSPPLPSQSDSPSCLRRSTSHAARGSAAGFATRRRLASLPTPSRGGSAAAAALACRARPPTRCPAACRSGARPARPDRAQLLQLLVAEARRGAQVRRRLDRLRCRRPGSGRCRTCLSEMSRTRDLAGDLADHPAVRGDFAADDGRAEPPAPSIVITDRSPGQRAAGEHHAGACARRPCAGRRPPSPRRSSGRPRLRR